MIGSKFRHSKAKGFTLIELLIVIGIILILMSLVIVAGKAVSNASRARSSRAALETAHAMYTEYESATHLNRQPVSIYQHGTANACVAVSASTSNATDFWYSTEDALGNNFAGPPAVGLITPDGPMTTQCDAVRNSSVMMGMLFSIPANKKMLSSLPSSSFVSNMMVSPQNTLLLDGWGNPIIYVPAGGLLNVTVGGVLGTISSTGFHVGSGYVPTALDRPFFMSAGPDGDLSKGDDNIYSFQ